MKLTFSTLVVCLLFGTSAFAAKFANQFTEFELPPQWQCSLEGAEWVCQSSNEAKKRDAIIVLAAKLKGDQDSLDQYLTYLKAAKSFSSIQGKPVKSEPKSAKTVNLNGTAWVDALHFESEIPGFYTRYLATIKHDIGVLVTYSISKTKYTEYLNDFEAMVKTIKVFRPTDGSGLLQKPSAGLPQISVPQSVGEGTVFKAGNDIKGGSDEAPPAKNDEIPLWMLVAAGAAVVGFIVWRKKRQSAD